MPTKLLCPWNFPGKYIGTGCHFLLQGLFTIQGLNPSLLCLLHWQEDPLPLCNLVIPVNITAIFYHFVLEKAHYQLFLYFSMSKDRQNNFIYVDKEFDTDL